VDLIKLSSLLQQIESPLLSLEKEREFTYRDVEDIVAEIALARKVYCFK
jgi:hypothetical protein